MTLGVIIIIGGKIGALIGGLSVLAKLKLAITAVVGLLSISAVLRHIVRGVQSLWNFNFQITDAQIRQQQESALQGLYTLAGDVVGYAIGTLVCGGATAGGVGLVRFNVRAAANVVRVLAINDNCFCN